LALDAKERIDQVLDNLDAKVAGLWSTSGLLARLGASKTLPDNLFVVVPGLQSMRILFLKERVPIISRLIREPSTSQLVTAEIIRTLRHLENTKVIERNSEKPPVLVLGNREGIAQGLLDEHVGRPISLPQWVGGRTPWPQQSSASPSGTCLPPSSEFRTHGRQSLAAKAL
jgi:hypothetical protein